MEISKGFREVLPEDKKSTEEISPDIGNSIRIETKSEDIFSGVIGRGQKFLSELSRKIDRRVDGFWRENTR